MIGIYDRQSPCLGIENHVGTEQRFSRFVCIYWHHEDILALSNAQEDGIIWNHTVSSQHAIEMEMNSM